MLLEIRHASVSRGGCQILKDFSFFIKGKEKIALVGRNGAGKSTLLQVLNRDMSLDVIDGHPEGDVRFSRAITAELFSQTGYQEDKQFNSDRREEEQNPPGEARLPGETGTACETAEDRDKRPAPVTLKDKGRRTEKGAEADKEKETGGESAGDGTTVEDLVRKAALRQGYGEDSPYYAAFCRQFYVSFTRLGFSLEDRKKALAHFSGGEGVKIRLLRLFALQPDLLLLDEPTNHLDLDAVEWLEDQVRAYPKALVVVSHDRYFLDQVAEVVWEAAGGRLTRYVGTYSQYREEKEKRYQKDLRRYRDQEEEIRRMEDLVRRFHGRPRKAALARTRARTLSKMDRLTMPVADDAHIHTEEILPNRIGAKIVLDCDHLSVGYRKEKPLRILSFRLRRGQKIGIFGPNGGGKTAFLKTLAGQLEPLDGKLSVSESAEVAYLDQMTAQVQSDQSIFDYFHDRYPALTGGEVRKVLAGYLFKGEDLGKRISDLSGGEKTRLALADLLQARPNLLLLDEPTNNMDIPARETLESIFRQYRGTLVFISHDRYFLSHVADQLLYFPPRSREVLFCPYSYDSFREKEKRRRTTGAELKDRDLLRLAEEERMIEGLHAVPKASPIQARPLSTDALQLDWEFGLNRETREKAEAAYQQASEAYNRAWEESYLDPATWKEDEGGTETESADREPAKKRGDRGAADRETDEAAEKDRACDAWTKELLDWYDLWLQTDEARQSFLNRSS